LSHRLYIHPDPCRAIQDFHHTLFKPDASVLYVPVCDEAYNILTRKDFERGDRLGVLPIVRETLDGLDASLKIGECNLANPFPVVLREGVSVKRRGVGVKGIIRDVEGSGKTGLKVWDFGFKVVAN
jgi:hypothetical protein